MGVVGDVCRKVAALAPAQIEELDAVSGLLELASDIAHAQLIVYAKARNDNFLVIVAQSRPNTSFLQYKPHLLGTTVYTAEEPLVWRTMTSGKPISGHREWALGMDVLEMQTFPLKDSRGEIIAVVSFECTAEEARATGHAILIETAYMLLTSGSNDLVGMEYYRSLTAHDGIVMIDERGQILFANSVARSIYKILGVGRIVGRRIFDRQVNMRLVQKAVSSGKPLEAEIEAVNLVLTQRAIPIIRAGQLVRVVFIIADVTEIRKKEKELLIKSAVIQEIHHRVKNNLQTIASLLRLQARRTRSPEVKAALRESVNRILSISVVHEFLSQQDREYIDVAEVAKNILDLVIQNMLEPDFNIQTVFNGQTAVLPSERATSLALVINELIQNAIEHGFVGRREGMIGVDISETKDTYKIEIYDDGIGLPPDFSLQSSNSLGLQIVRTLIEDDLRGRLELYSNRGTCARIMVPRAMEGEQV